jgi:hypothetical protein
MPRPFRSELLGRVVEPIFPVIAEKLAFVVHVLLSRHVKVCRKQLTRPTLADSRGDLLQQRHCSRHRTDVARSQRDDQQKLTEAVILLVG